jgi:RNA polymerase sigma factor (TIGR02999 family)
VRRQKQVCPDPLLAIGGVEGDFLFFPIRGILVHEAYLKLVDVDNVDWQHRAHFFAISAQIMRRILLDRARRRAAAKRGGAAPRLNLEELPDVGSGRARELVALDDVLNALAQVDPRKAKVVELRFFGGLDAEETAEVLNVSPDTVRRDWRLARAWLLAELGDPRASGA